MREVFIFLFVFSHYKSNEFFPFIIHFLVPSLTFLAIGGFTLPISGGFTLRKIGGAKLLITPLLLGAGYGIFASRSHSDFVRIPCRGNNISL